MICFHGIQLVVGSGFGEPVLHVEYLHVVVPLQDVHDAASVPVIRHSTSVVDVPGSVLEHLGEEIVVRGKLDVGGVSCGSYHTHTHMHTCAHSHTYTHMHTCAHSHIYAHTCIHVHTHTYMYTHAYTCTHSHHTHTYAHKYNK